MRFFIITLFFILIISDLYALSIQEEANRQNISEQQRIVSERNKIRFNKERKEFEKIERSKSKIEAIKKKKMLSDDKGGCIKFVKVKIEGNSIYDSKFLLEKFFSDIKEKCYKKSDMINSKNKIINFYIEKGYSNTRAYFDMKTLKIEFFHYILQKEK